MLYKDILKVLGLYFSWFSLVFLFPLSLALYELWKNGSSDPFPDTTRAFLLSFILTLAFGGVLFFFGKKSKGHLYRKEGILIVVLIWFLTPIFCCLPFSLSQTLKNPFQSYFEAVSGLTTTGFTVITPKKFDSEGKDIPIERLVKGELNTLYRFYGNIDPIRNNKGQILYEGIEALGKPLLFWRSFLQFLGGGGIIVLFVAILPALGVGGKMLYQNEVTGPIKTSLTPRIKESALQIWRIYSLLVVIQIFILMITNGQMPLFDAVTISFTTIATGGFSIKNANIGAYQSAATEWVVILFMIIGSVNFSLYYAILKGKFDRLYDRELLYFILIILGFSLFNSWLLMGHKKSLLVGNPEGIFSPLEALRYGIFHTVSSQTTSGFTTVDYDFWPYPVQAILLIVMFFGGMSGSTTGGMKVIRLHMLFSIAKEKIQHLFMPDSIRKFEVGENKVDTAMVIHVLCFFLIVITVGVLATFIFILDKVDPETSLGMAVSAINNVGFSFRAGGPTESCAFLSNLGLSLCSFLMIFGRLEYFAILALFVPSFWRHK